MSVAGIADLCRDLQRDETREVKKELIVAGLEYKVENSKRRKEVCVLLQIRGVIQNYDLIIIT